MSCVHRWRIAEQGAPTSEGQCAYCGQVRQFANSDPRYEEWAVNREWFHRVKPRQWSKWERDEQWP